ncbi:PREDICTED: RWD domain-containing protein 1 [Rhagoletis zephyria]|uniref:RWD domain-containing protein 1 n=1 Tax=Rhagoletis zephyria TaxID=28612 RepID=UPI0008115532|nr:PREDICTED: RWD domain-containing protein 1 [Rhagoletis zephyria]
MSRNHKEDQSNEIEALESIYYSEMEVLETDPFHKFSITIGTEQYNAEEESSGMACKLVFTYTPSYPDQAPDVSIEDPVNMEELYETKLLEHLKNIIDENIGMEMIFSLVSSAQEWLNERWDDYKLHEEEERARKLYESEEAERKKFEGTRVTVESFLKWRTEFEESTGIAAKREKNSDSKKLTGRELFMRDTTLNESDIKFLLEAGESIENVKIDETLFQDIGDLELGDDDDSDDEDWVPGADDD